MNVFLNRKFCSKCFHSTEKFKKNVIPHDITTLNISSGKFKTENCLLVVDYFPRCVLTELKFRQTQTQHTHSSSFGLVEVVPRSGWTLCCNVKVNGSALIKVFP